MAIVVVILLVETLLASFASYFLKKSAAVDNKVKILLSPYFYLGGILYVLSALGGVYLLQKLPYAICLPLGSITYVWTMFVSYFLLKEKITARKIAGMLVIMAGVVLIGVGSTM